MKAPSSLRVICIMCFIFVIISSIPMFSGVSGFFATLTAICTIICLLTARLKSWFGRLLIALIPLVLLLLVKLLSAMDMSLLLFITSAAVSVFFAVFMTIGRFGTEYWKFRKTYLWMTGLSVFTSVLYFFIYVAVTEETKATMNLPGVMGFTLALALMGMFVLTEMRSGEPDAKWRAKNAGRIIAIFSAAAAALVFLFLILSFILSFITPTIGPQAEKLKTERLRFESSPIFGYSPLNMKNGQVEDEDSMKDNTPVFVPEPKPEKGFHWEYIGIAVIVVAVAAFFIIRYLKRKKAKAENPDVPKTPEEQEQLDNIMAIRRIYKQYISFVRSNGGQLTKGSTSEDILAFSKVLSEMSDEEEPDPSKLEKGTEAEEKLREIYIRARYGSPEGITAEDVTRATELLAVITSPKEEN